MILKMKYPQQMILWTDNKLQTQVLKIKEAQYLNNKLYSLAVHHNHKLKLKEVLPLQN